MAPSIPDRWIPYKACGDIIEGTRLICFKVPLRRTVQLNITPKNIWDIKALLKAIPGLGAVIDLTNTARYYNPNDLKTAGIKHKKILMPGRIIPPEDKVTQFMNAVDVFLGIDDDSLVGVHCTHGLNRTGYMVCRYMRDRLGIPAKEAIKRFETARGYKIERENYIADLLGKLPPPPDVGKETIVKPVVNRNVIEYRSPLDEYDDEVRDTNRYETRKRRFGSYPSHGSGRTDYNRDESSYEYSGNRNGYDRDNSSIKRSKTNGSDSRSRTSSYQSDCEYKYDYKYDY